MRNKFGSFYLRLINDYNTLWILGRLRIDLVSLLFHPPILYPEKYLISDKEYLRTTLGRYHSVFGLRISFNADQDPAFFVNADLDPDPDLGFLDTLDWEIFFFTFFNNFWV